MLGGLSSSGLAAAVTWVKGLLRGAYNLLPLGGANGGFIIRQKGGIAGTAECQIYQDATSLNFSTPTVGAYNWNFLWGGSVVAAIRHTGNIAATGSIAPGGAANSWTSSSLSLGSGNPLTWTDVSLYRVAAGVVGSGTGAASGLGWFQNRAGRSRLTADVTNATATMANLTDLSQTVISGRKYFGQCVIFASNSTALEGLQFDFNGGTATFTSFVYGLVGTPIGATIGTAYATSAATALTATTATTGDVAYLIAFEFVCNAGGTVVPRGAEVSHTTGTATFRLGSFLLTEDSPN